MAPGSAERASVAAVLAAVAVACSATPRDPPSGPPPTGEGGAGGAPTSTSTTGSGGARPSAPPTLESCRAQAPPNSEVCSWALLPTGYCGGPPPSREMTWPHCSCEVCGIDADCPAGMHCAALPTDANCHPQKTLCLAAANPCTANGGCKAPEQCMWLGPGRAGCQVPTMYPPAP